MSTARSYRLDTYACKRLALNKGLSEKQLLIKAGCSRDILCRSRRGGLTSAATLGKLARVLDCDPLDLIVEEVN